MYLEVRGMCQTAAAVQHTISSNTYRSSNTSSAISSCSTQQQALLVCVHQQAAVLYSSTAIILQYTVASTTCCVRIYVCSKQQQRRSFRLVLALLFSRILSYFAGAAQHTRPKTISRFTDGYLSPIFSRYVRYWERKVG